DRGRLLGGQPEFGLHQLGLQLGALLRRRVLQLLQLGQNARPSRDQHRGGDGCEGDRREATTLHGSPHVRTDGLYWINRGGDLEASHASRTRVATFLSRTSGRNVIRTVEWVRAEPGEAESHVAEGSPPPIACTTYEKSSRPNSDAIWADSTSVSTSFRYWR